MVSKKKEQHHHKRKKREQQEPVRTNAPPKRLEIVLKCDTSGCIEAITDSIPNFHGSEVETSIISSGVGAVNKSDIFMAETGSKLIVGFNVGIMPHIEHDAAEHNVEIRLYDVIYELLEDLKTIANSFLPKESQEKILGSAKVIALFKSSRKGIILGCEVLEGRLATGSSFRILTAMGPVYTGKIESLHIEKDAVREATRGQQVGLKISDFNKVAIGDLVESFQPDSGKQTKPWQSQGKIVYP